MIFLSVYLYNILTSYLYFNTITITNISSTVLEFLDGRESHVENHMKILYFYQGHRLGRNSLFFFSLIITVLYWNIDGLQNKIQQDVCMNYLYF